MRAWVVIVFALAGLSQAMDVSLDPPKTEYARPWKKGVNICAYITRPGDPKHKIWSYCLPWKQDYYGGKSAFKYDCCPGFKRTSKFDNLCVERERTWKTIPQLLKVKRAPKFGDLLSNKKTGAGHGPLTNTKPSNTVTHTVFAPATKAWDNQVQKWFGQKRFAGRPNHPILFSVVKGRYYSDRFRNGQVLTSDFQNLKLKITKYSNGIICIECRPLVEPDHEAMNGVIHYINGIMFPRTASVGKLLLTMGLSSVRSFATSIPSDVRKLLNGGAIWSERPWFTVFAPTNRAWNAAIKKYGKQNTAALVKAHIIKQLYCTAALVGKKQDLGPTLSGDRLTASCDGSGRRFITARFGGTSMITNPDLVGTNGVVHIIDKVLVPSRFFTFKQFLTSKQLPQYIGSSIWIRFLQECDLRMQNTLHYAIMIPNQRAFDWWEKYARFQKYYQRFLTDKAFRCRLIRFHIVAMRGGRESTLYYQWLQQSGYRTNNVDKLWEVDYFLRRDYGSQFYFHYSPIYPFYSYRFNRGSFYFIDRVNMIPEMRLIDVLRTTNYLSTMYQKTKAGQMDQKVFRRYEPRTLYLAIRNDGWKGSSVSAKAARGYQRSALYNFLRLHWINNWLWGGDIGYFEKRSRHRFMSGVGLELIFDRHMDGKMYIGYQGLAFSRWALVIQWNLFGIDGNIWVINRPLPCPPKYCRKTKVIEKEVWKVLTFACWESLGAARGAKARDLEPWLDKVQGKQCYTNRQEPKSESSTHG